MKRKMIIFIIILLMAVLVPLATVRFMRVGEQKNYSSVKTFEEETQLNFYDIYDVDAYLFNNEKIKLSEISLIDIQFDKELENQYRIKSDKSKYPYYIEMKSNKTENGYYKSKAIDGITINYNYFSDNHSYEFIVYEKDFQYKFTVDNTSNIEEQKLFVIIKSYILLNKEIIL